MANIKTVFKKILILTMAVLICCSSLACNSGGPSGSPKASREDVKIWSIGTNEKVVLEGTEEFKDLYSAAPNIDLVVGKNEYESATVVISAPKTKIQSYDVELSDLKSAANDTYSKDNVEVYSLLYYISGASGDYYSKEGKYPDAILPFEKAVEYKENYVDKDTNQSVYFEFYIPENQPAGTFTGNFKITCDDNEFLVPVTLRVYDFGITDESHLRSSYNLAWALPDGERDTSLEMRRKYIDYLTEHRVSSLYIFADTPSTDEGWAEWLELAAELCEDPKFTDLSFNVPDTKYDSIIINGYEYNFTSSLPNYEWLADKFYIIGKRCLEDEEGKLDIFKRLLFKGFDEPELWGQSWDWIRGYHYNYIRAKELAAEMLLPFRTIDNAEHFDTLMESLDGIPVVITAQTRYPTANTIDKSRIDGIDFCPYFSRLNSKADRDLFKSMSDHGLWAYGCNTPDSPYPNYHIPDALMSARVFGWMAFEYGLVGDLYWAVDAWGNEPDYDYYAGKKPSDPGEGILLYPGQPYGIDGPVGSIRLNAIRDGREEYEILYLIEQTYKAKNADYSFVPMVETLSDYLYAEMQCSYDFDAFDKSRTALYQLMELASSNAGIRIVDVEESGGLYKMTIYANEGYTPKNAGVALSKVRDVIGADGVNGSEYLLSIQLGNGVTGIDLSCDVDGYTVSFDWYLGNAAVGYNAESFANSFSSGNAGRVFEATLVDANTVVSDRPADEKWLHLDYVSCLPGYNRDVVVRHEAFDDIGVTTKKIVFNVYNANDFNTMFNVRFRPKQKGVGDQTLKSFTLKPGMNSIVVDNVFALSWQKRKGVEFMYFTTGIVENKETQFDRLNNIYLVDFSIYEV
ncbi:MAG: DUF4091 domain-containing protein [Clostridia bacterium]|nr:DUF4091 domain-containing protein [Clostridia bacterium]